MASPDFLEIIRSNRQSYDMSDNADLAALIRNIPDYPKPGIMVRDVSSLLLDASGYRTTIDRLAALVDPDTTLVAGIEARGFIFGAALAAHLGIGFIPIRKSGKLPRETHRREYELEYGVDAIEIHIDAVCAGDRVLVIDDVLATGGTACAAIALVEQCSASAVGLAVLLNLEFLGGAQKVASQFPSVDVFTVFPNA
jgi:adenine phosphoribosyltransferase